MICTGCGAKDSKEVPCTGLTVSRICALCADCSATLNRELEHCEKIRRETGYGVGPKFLAVYWSGENTIGVGLYISKTAAEAMAEALRLAEFNKWLLLRVDYQKMLQDIYRHEDYKVYFPYTYNKNSPLLYEPALYGEIPPLEKA